jgi:hypothetical protein
MGIMQYFSTDDFYTSAGRSDFCPGQLCRIPVPHIDPIPRILDVRRDQPEEHDTVEFEIRNGNRRDDFRKRDRTLPLKYLNLKSNEELLVQVAKKRFAVILSPRLDIYPEVASALRQQGKKHLQEDAIFLIPIYGTVSPFRPTGFPPEMVQRVRYMIYRQFFYIPSKMDLEEGVARFDRISVVIGRDPSAIEPLEVSLSDKIFPFFLQMFLFCTTGVIDPNAEEIRSILRECYPG